MFLRRPFREQRAMFGPQALSSALIFPIGFLYLVALCSAPAVRAQDAPQYKVDASWPKPLPNNWTIGGIGGLAVDKDDHIWVYHRPSTITPAEAGAEQNPPVSICCYHAPAVLEFDFDGAVLQAWGGPGWVADWPAQEHGITVDADGNVWLGGNGPGGAGIPDRQLLKFTHDGKQLLKEIGHPSSSPANNTDTMLLGGPAQVTLDPRAQEMYVADGYVNKRVLVFDVNTFALKRGWGAYGIALSAIDNSPSPQYVPPGTVNKNFWGPVHCVQISVDGLVYVCDRNGDRIQVFTKQGQFIKEFFVAPKTLGTGSVYGILFSHDPRQKFLLVGDGSNNVIWILDRSDGSVVGSIGHSGGNAGQFRGLHQMAMDSRGNIYTGETGIKRAQRFLLVK
jgi:DNA-binding beta-propeller fold protein YncE